MTHLTEAEFEDILYEWFVGEVGEEQVMQQVYQPGPYWFVDLIVKRPEVTWYIEVENDRGSIRDGVGQALGYAAGHEGGEPMVIVPAGHLEQSEIERLRQTQAVLIREFDVDEEEFVA